LAATIETQKILEIIVNLETIGLSNNRLDLYEAYLDYDLAGFQVFPRLVSRGGIHEKQTKLPDASIIQLEFSLQCHYVVDP
jgi:hypothetical protein